MRSGDKVTLEVRNELPETTTVHWHGLLIPAAVDGGPNNAIPAGQAWQAVLPVQQAASTCWYHRIRTAAPACMCTGGWPVC